MPKKIDILQQELTAEGILRLTLNDTSRRNALSENMLTELGVALAQAHQDAKIRVVVIAANGPAFSAGHDLKEITSHRSDADNGKAYFAHLMSLCSNVMQAVVECAKPVIAEVDGVTTAAGCQLVASCDLAVGSETSKFSTPGVNIGLFCSTPMVALSRNISPKHAMEMLLTGENISAHHAVEIGLLNRAVPSSKLHETVMALAKTIASKSSLTLATGKRAFYKQHDMSLSQAYDYASGIMVENLLIPDAQEGIGAFLEKRAPKWHGS